jgi:phospholipid/cholesterol/gamma-HCH transport system substrate-binding protein
MKKTVGNRIRLGIFVSIGFVLLIVAIYFVGQRQQLFSSTFRVSGIFKDINGLQVGNDVRFSGINVGIVEGIIQITDTTVQVDMLIEQSAKRFIKKNAKALIGADGLMGNKIVSIIPSGPCKQGVIADNDYIATVKPISLDDIMLNVKLASDNAVDITDDISTITASIVAGKGVMGKLFMDSALGQNLDKALVNIKQGAGGFKENMDAAGHSFLLRGFIKKKEKDKEKEKEKEKAKKDVAKR